MIFDDGRQMLRLEVIDTGFFDEDMTSSCSGTRASRMPTASGACRT